MKSKAACVFPILAFSALYAWAGDRLVDGFPELPQDARHVAERSVACIHFWGEATGTGDQRDREVSDRLRELRCDRIERDLDEVRLKYKNAPKILKVLKEAVEGVG